MDRTALEARAKELGLTFPANIGDEKLAAKVAEAEKPAEDNKNKPAPTNQAPAGQSGSAGKTGGKKSKSKKQDDEDVLVVAKLPVTHDGEDYAPGEDFICTPKQRDALRASGAIEPNTDD